MEINFFENAKLKSLNGTTSYTLKLDPTHDFASIYKIINQFLVTRKRLVFPYYWIETALMNHKRTFTIELLKPV